MITFITNRFLLEFAWVFDKAFSLVILAYGYGKSSLNPFASLIKD